MYMNAFNTIFVFMLIAQAHWWYDLNSTYTIYASCIYDSVLSIHVLLLIYVELGACFDKNI